MKSGEEAENLKHQMKSNLHVEVNMLKVEIAQGHIKAFLTTEIAQGHLKAFLTTGLDETDLSLFISVKALGNNSQAAKLLIREG